MYLDLLVRLLYPRGMGKDVTFIKKFEVSVVFSKHKLYQVGECRVSLLLHSEDRTKDPMTFTFMYMTGFYPIKGLTKPLTY